MMKFGFYIALVEIPLELTIGKINTPCIFISGGLAACLADPRKGLANNVSKFLGSGTFIGLLGMFMNKGNDKM